MTGNDKHLEKHEQNGGEQPLAGAQITKREDSVVKQRQEVLNGLKSHRITKDGNGFTLDMGNGETVQDIRAAKMTAVVVEQQANRSDALQGSVSSANAVRAADKGDLKNGVPDEWNNGKPQLQTAEQSEMTLQGKAPVSETNLSVVTADKIYQSTDGVILPPKMTEEQQMLELIKKKLNVAGKLNAMPADPLVGVILQPKMGEGQQLLELVKEKLNQPTEFQLLKGENFLIAEAPNFDADKTRNVHDMLVQFNEKLKMQLHLSGEPTLEDVQRAAVQQPPLNREDALACAIVIAYYIHGGPRQHETLSQFGAEHLEEFQHRGDVYQLKPLNQAHLTSDDIQQRFPDDCPFMSTLISLANRQGMNSVLDMVKVNNEKGGYDVYFPGLAKTPGEYPIHINGLTMVEKMIASGSGDSLYLAVLEKAYGMHIAKVSRHETSIVPAVGVKYCNDDAYTGEPITCLTGNRYETLSTQFTPDHKSFDEFKTVLTAASRAGDLVIAGVKLEPNPNPFDLDPGHAYAMISCNDGFIELRDPLHPDWKKKIPLQYFYDNFNKVHIERKK